MKEETTRKT